MSEINIYYAVMVVKKNIVVNVFGLEQEVEYVHLPVFKNKTDAEKVAGGKFEIIEMLTKKALGVKG